MGTGVESRFEHYSDVLVEALGHADRATPARWYLRGLMLPGERKSVEPMAARVRQNGLTANRLQSAGLLGTSLVDRLSHIHREMESVQHVNGLTGFLGKHLQIQLPHTITNESRLGRPLSANHPKGTQQGFDGPRQQSDPDCQKLYVALRSARVCLEPRNSFNLSTCILQSKGDLK